MDDNDFVMRQVKSFAEELGIVLNNRDGSKSQVVFEQEQGRSGTIEDEINKLLFKKKYDSAVRLVFEQKFILEHDDYLKLAYWLLNELNSCDDVDEELITELTHSIYKVAKM
ncbi:DUF6483 family protein [Companilactobacillus nodensis]|uniref:Uncharacterized protein n=1 Tax=Companilactobacillus nodensis DSM 19682 = JCM 14932 = NBRC 107160 TaxID=1423775 RepID=A0A0R1KAY0_9LACO|nr:DUF6483 family protein [Companilactobacillus nodensis]KRK80838.1 hypothetical protein FD03_GL000972 [Companilactobacillus nodensis DSM 19682 = JCM 14932 = NBRC 107160]